MVHQRRDRAFHRCKGKVWGPPSSPNWIFHKDLSYQRFNESITKFIANVLDFEHDPFEKSQILNQYQKYCLINNIQNLKLISQKR